MTDCTCPPVDRLLAEHLAGRPTDTACPVHRPEAPAAPPDIALNDDQALARIIGAALNNPTPGA